MPAIVRLTKKELIDLIEGTEAAGCDTACLRGLLAEVEEAERRRQLARREAAPGAKPEEMPAQKLLEENRELYTYTLGLFVTGEVTENMLNDMAEYDSKYSASKLQKELEERQLSTVGQKHILCARLLADEKGWGKS